MRIWRGRVCWILWVLFWRVFLLFSCICVCGTGSGFFFGIVVGGRVPTLPAVSAIAVPVAACRVRRRRFRPGMGVDGGAYSSCLGAGGGVFCLMGGGGGGSVCRGGCVWVCVGWGGGGGYSVCSAGVAARQCLRSRRPSSPPSARSPLYGVCTEFDSGGWAQSLAHDCHPSNWWPRSIVLNLVFWERVLLLRATDSSDYRSVCLLADACKFDSDMEGTQYSPYFLITESCSPCKSHWSHAHWHKCHMTVKMASATMFRDVLYFLVAVVLFISKFEVFDATTGNKHLTMH